MNTIKPLVLTDTSTGEQYTLEFSREDVRFAEQRKFNISELTEYPQTNIPALFYFAFRMHHPNVARSKTDQLLNELGGLRPEEIERLVQLYQRPTESLIQLNEDARKNARVTLEL